MYVQGMAVPRALGRQTVEVLQWEFPGKVEKEEKGPRLTEGHVQRHCCVKKNLQEHESYLLRVDEDETKEAGICYITHLDAG